MFIYTSVCLTKKIDDSFHEVDNDSALVQAFPDVDAGA